MRTVLGVMAGLGELLLLGIGAAILIAAASFTL
jgi:hypothetical protein